jgi:hypothetical protein
MCNLISKPTKLYYLHVYLNRERCIKQLNSSHDINHTIISRTFVLVAKRWDWVYTPGEEKGMQTGNSASIQTGWLADTQLHH